MLASIAILVDDLRLLVESQPPLEWRRLGQHLPYEWSAFNVVDVYFLDAEGGEVQITAVIRHPSQCTFCPGERRLCPLRGTRLRL
ncbi:hypothetical protein OKW43_008520 [Paraburkholderia sp. WC7.3g]|uniref:hypothetical protein n=1 Tax=Paraburkholderia TaxID=1822464 RepID=UPI001FE3DE25|nr:hypothetical protein [Paraburkholderia podalyriae]